MSLGRIRPSPSPVRAALIRLGRLVLLVPVIAACSGFVALAVLPVAGALSVAVERLQARFLPEAGTPLYVPPFPQRSVIYAADGSVLATVYLDQDRAWVPLSEVNAGTREAVLAIEDHGFFQHGPLDPSAILRALIENLRAGRIVQGGSTIAQQLAKNAFTGSAETLGRKLAETQDAIRLERTYSKDQILEMYLNQVYLGNGVYGIGTAARYYFGRPPWGLTLPQAALLAGMIQAPAVYDPIAHPARALARRNVVLGRMLFLRWIDPAQYLAASGTPVRLSSRQRSANRPGPQPYFVRFVEDWFLHDPGFGRTYPERVHELFQGGLRIYTTLEPRLQAEALAAVRAHLPDPGDPGAAVVTIDPHTGAIEALVGGRSFHRSQFDLATQSIRSAGSAFKAFTLTAALEEHIPPSATFPSASPITIPDCGGTGVSWHVGNAEPGTGGSMDLWEATKFSVNVVFAQLIDRVGPARVAQVAHRMGITSPLQPYCPLTLGASGVSPLEMTSAYATLDDGGVHCVPYAVSRILGRDGTTVYRTRPQCTRAVPGPVAWEVTAMLQGVVQGGTGTAADIGRPQAGKTGTAGGFHDAWFMGYVPQLVTGVWVGFPRAELPMLDVHGLVGFGGLLAAPIWHDYMLRATRGLPALRFPPPPIPQGSPPGASASPAASPTPTPSATR